jgi:tetratricopeptide (TPR) repeat protein
METLQLVCLEWISEEREKRIWEDLYVRSWDEIMGRMYLLKANDTMVKISYEAALADFEQALVLLPKDGVEQSYYMRALNDKALAQCFLGEAEVALATIDQALAVKDQSYQDIVLTNRGAILVLTGTYSEALEILSQQLKNNPKDCCARFTLATCLLHMDRYKEAIDAYEKVIAEGLYLGNEGLEAARLGKQPAWDNL